MHEAAMWSDNLVLLKWDKNIVYSSACKAQTMVIVITCQRNTENSQRNTCNATLLLQVTKIVLFFPHAGQYEKSSVLHCFILPQTL